MSNLEYVEHQHCDLCDIGYENKKDIIKLTEYNYLNSRLIRNDNSFQSTLFFNICKQGNLHYICVNCINKINLRRIQSAKINNFNSG